jgi:hypothetical protein
MAALSRRVMYGCEIGKQNQGSERKLKRSFKNSIGSNKASREIPRVVNKANAAKLHDSPGSNRD